MRTARGLAGAAVIAVPVLLAGAAPTTAPITPARCYGGVTYTVVEGYPTAHEAVAANLRTVRVIYDDLRRRAPQLTDDPYFPTSLGRWQGAVEGFTALLDETPIGSRPAFDETVRAFDDDGQLIARVTFASWIAADQGTYAIGGATLPDLSADPAHDCRARSTT
jgi:hypothetical protein